MINNIKYFTILFVLLTLLSCRKDIESPEISFTADKVNLQVGETVTFNISGDAETFAIFTGDNTHEFSKSHLAVTAGVDVDQEEVVLTADSLVSLTPGLTAKVYNYNDSLVGGTPLSVETILGNLETLVDKKYTNKETAAYEIYLFMEDLGSAEARDMVNLYYENHSVLLAPEGGFSIGVAINRDEKSFEYAYNEPGTYTVTLIATNASYKKYSGSGYQDDRTSSGSEYDLNRTIKEISITVQ